MVTSPSRERSMKKIIDNDQRYEEYYSKSNYKQDGGLMSSKNTGAEPVQNVKIVNKQYPKNPEP